MNTTLTIACTAVRVSRRPPQMVAVGVMALTGAAMVAGKLTGFVCWLLERFSILAGRMTSNRNSPLLPGKFIS